MATTIDSGMAYNASKLPTMGKKYGLSRVTDCGLHPAWWSGLGCNTVAFRLENEHGTAGFVAYLLPCGKIRKVERIRSYTSGDNIWKSRPLMDSKA